MESGFPIEKSLQIPGKGGWSEDSTKKLDLEEELEWSP